MTSLLRISDLSLTISIKVIISHNPYTDKDRFHTCYSATEANKKVQKPFMFMFCTVTGCEDNLQKHQESYQDLLMFTLKNGKHLSRQQGAQLRVHVMALNIHVMATHHCRSSAASRNEQSVATQRKSCKHSRRLFRWTSNFRSVMYEYTCCSQLC